MAAVDRRCGCGGCVCSAFGLSTWVALAFALVMAGWMVWVLLWEAGSRPRVPTLLLAGVVAVVALLPYVTELRSAQSGTSVGKGHGRGERIERSGGSRCSGAKSRPSVS